MVQKMQSHEEFHLRMALCQQPLPQLMGNTAIMVELSQRTELVLFYYVNDEFSTADGVLKLVRSGSPDNQRFVILENGEVIAKFFKHPAGDELNRFKEGKDEQVIKMLRVFLCRFMKGRRGLHIYHPPYPEPELLTIEDVEGQDYPRRFVRQEWLHWMEDCHDKNPLILNAAMRVVSKRIFPEGSEGKTFKTKGIIPEKGLEFEILEVKRV